MPSINPLAPQDGALLRAIGRGEWAVTGFRNRDLCRCLYGAKPKDARCARRQSAAMSRRLRLLRAHGLIRKIPRTHRYSLSEQGRNLVTALVAAQQADTQKLTALAA